MMILATNPAIATDRVYPYENRYLAYICRLVDHISTPFTQKPGWNMQQLLEGPDNQIGPLPFSPLSIDPTDLAARATRHLWTAFSESIATHTHGPCHYYAEKTWGNNLETLAKAGIKSKLINLVRDPRDVLASIYAFDAKRGYYGFGRNVGEPTDDYLVRLVHDMYDKLKRMRLRTKNHDHLWIRYEDLIIDRPKIGARLSEWIGLELQTETVVPRGKTYKQHSTTAKPVKSIGRWRKDLQSTDVSYIEEILGTEMTQLGYHR